MFAVAFSILNVHDAALRDVRAAIPVVTLLLLQTAQCTQHASHVLCNCAEVSDMYCIKYSPFAVEIGQEGV